MPPLVPLQQTEFVKPRQSTYIAPNTPSIYIESPAQIPDIPQGPTSISGGIDWDGLAEAADVAQEIYGEYLNSVIDGQSDSIANLKFDLEDKVNSAFNKYRLGVETEQGKPLTRAQSLALIRGDPLESTSSADLLEFLKISEDSRAEYQSGVVALLGQDRWDRYVNGSPDIMDLGSAYRKLAVQTRKGSYDIDSVIADRLYNVSQTEARITKNRLTGKQWENNDTDSLTLNGVKDSKPINGISSGQTPVPVAWAKSVGLIDQNGKILTDSNGQPLGIITNKNEFQFDPSAKQSELSEKVARMLAMAESANVMTPDNRTVNPHLVELIQKELANKTTPRERFTLSVLLSQLPPEAMNTLASEAKIGVRDVELIHMLRFRGMNSYTQEQLTRRDEDHEYNQDIIFDLNDVLSDLRGTTDNELTTAVNARSVDAVSGFNGMLLGLGARGVITPEQVTEFTIGQARVSRADSRNRNLLNSRYLHGNAATPENTEEWLRNNPYMRRLAVEFTASALSLPEIYNEQDATKRSVAIGRYVQDQMSLFAVTSGMVYIDDKVAFSPKLALSIDSVRATRAAQKEMNKPVTPEQQARQALRDKDSDVTVLTRVAMSSNGFTGITESDSYEDGLAKAENMIRNMNPNVNMIRVRMMLPWYARTKITSQGVAVKQDFLTDGDYLRIAVASNPEVWGMLNDFKTQDPTQSVQDAANALTPKEWADQFHSALGKISHASQWKTVPDTHERVLNADNGGIEIAFQDIPATDSAGNIINILPEMHAPGVLIDGKFFGPQDQDGDGKFMVGSEYVLGSQADNVSSQTNLRRAVAEDHMHGMNGTSPDSMTINDSYAPKSTVMFDMDSLLDFGGLDSNNDMLDILSDPVTKQIKGIFKDRNYTDAYIESFAQFEIHLNVAYAQKLIQAIIDADPANKGRTTNNLMFYATGYAVDNKPENNNNPDSLFNKVNLEKLYHYSKSRGARYLSEYIGAMYTVAAIAEKNQEFNGIHDTAAYRRNKGGASSEGANRDFVTNLSSDEYGLILWAPQLDAFPQVIERLISEGYSIYKDKETQRYYADRFGYINNNGEKVLVFDAQAPDRTIASPEERKAINPEYTLQSGVLPLQWVDELEAERLQELLLNK